MTPTDLAWFAGFFEGEGTLRINAFQPRHLGVVHASVVSTDEDYVRRFDIALLCGRRRSIATPLATTGARAADGRSRATRSWNLYLLMRELNARGLDGPSQRVICMVLDQPEAVSA